MDATTILNLTPEAVSLVVTTVVIPFAKRGLDIASKALQHRINNDDCNKYIDAVERAIETAVTSVGQTFVDSLKKSGKFDTTAQAEAFEAAKAKAWQMLSDDAKKAFEVLHGDLGIYISNRIEHYVSINKSISANGSNDQDNGTNKADEGADKKLPSDVAA